MEQKPINHGLKITWRTKLKKRDPRNFSRKKRFGAIDVSQIPDFDLVPDAPIKNQLSSFLCTAFANSTISGFQEGVELSPEYAYQKSNALLGVKHSIGVDYFIALKEHVKFGCLEASQSPYTIAKDGQYVAENPDNWDIALDVPAAIHKKQSYFQCDQGDDLFDSVLIALWQSYQAYQATKNISDLKAVSIAFYWFPEFTFASQGIVPESDTWNKKLASGHNVVVRGKKTINGIPYLIVQNSYGEGMGDKGLYYFPRKTLNTCGFAAATFDDLNPEETKKNQWGYMAQLLDMLSNLLRELLGKV